MGIVLSATAKLLLNKTHKGPNLILEIEGAPNIYSALDVFKNPFFDDTPLLYFDQAGLYFDKGVLMDNAISLISLSGSGAKIQNQLMHDKGATSSISTLNVELIDVNGEISNLVSPGQTFTDLLNRNCVVYLNFEGGVHPNDSITIHRGVITKIKNTAVSSVLQISHPERKKKQKVFVPSSTQLSAQALVGDTTLNVDSTEGFLTPGNALETYVRINDEIIKYTGITTTTITGCTRAQFGTIAAQHEIDNDVNTNYRLQGTAIDLALKIMMSGSGEYGITDTIMYLGAYSPTELDSSIIMFSYFDIQKKIGFTIGDTIRVYGDSNPSNNTSFIIAGYGTTDLGSYVQITGTLTLNLTTTASCVFQSKYDVLNDGMAMNGTEVDVVRHEELQTKFLSSLPSYDFLLREEINGEWIANQIYFPANIYAIPRDAKASIGITAPPIADEKIIFLNETNVTNPDELQPERGFNDSFYNSVLVRYNFDEVDDKYLSTYVNYSGDSQNRFNTEYSKLGNQPLIIESTGMKPSGSTSIILATNARNILDRFQFAPERIDNVKIMSKEGYQLEVGDIVAFGSSSFKLLNISTGNKDGEIKYYEVVNKSLDVKTADVTLSLLQTDFDATGRYGLIAPATLIGTGSTTSEIIFQVSYGSASFTDEKAKWEDFIGEQVRFFSPDYSYDHSTTLIGFSTTQPDKLTVSPALPSPPLSGYCMEFTKYDDTVALNQQKQKLLYCHFTPQLIVVSGISGTQFTVSAGDAAKLFVGSLITIHSSDYSVDSAEVYVTNVTGTTITVGTSFGFTPSAGQKIELVGFLDGGKPYRIYVL